MILPRFSIRRMLALTAGCALMFWVLAMASRNVPWALGISYALGAAILSFLLFGLFFYIAWFVSLLVRDFYQPKTSRSPFAHEAPPPQIITPEDPQS